MARLNVPPTKSNLFRIKDQLAIAIEGYDLLEQKREILVMELMQVVKEVKALEAEIDARIASSYPALERLLFAFGRENRVRLRSP